MKRLIWISTSSAQTAGKSRSSRAAAARTIYAYILSREPGSLLLGVATQRQLDQLVDQLRHGETAVFPHLGIHTDRGKTGDGIDLVDVQKPTCRLQQEVDAGHTGALYRTIALHCQLA